MNPVATARPPAARRADAVVRLAGAGCAARGRWLFRGLDLALHPGEVLAVLGPSGAGKSTLLTCLAGTAPLAEGRREAAAPGPAAMVHQDLRLVPQATLLANVLMARLPRHPWWRTLRGFPRAERAAAGEALAEVELAALAHRLVGEVSGGEQQRTALARALFAGAPLLLADEPVASLNETLARRCLARLRDHARARGAAVVCVLHHEEQARAVADAVLRLGPEWPDGWTAEGLAAA